MSHFREFEDTRWAEAPTIPRGLGHLSPSEEQSRVEKPLPRKSGDLLQLTRKAKAIRVMAFNLWVKIGIVHHLAFCLILQLFIGNSKGRHKL